MYVEGALSTRMLKFSDGAYIIATGEFRPYTTSDYVCQENTFGYPFPGREHDDEAKATLQQMYGDTCLDDPEMIHGSNKMPRYPWQASILETRA